MMGNMKRWIIACGVAILNLLHAPLLMAQDEAPEFIDARLAGYSNKVQLEPSSTATTWLLLVFLGVLCCGVMFKNAKRTHLD